MGTVTVTVITVMSVEFCSIHL